MAVCTSTLAVILKKEDVSATIFYIQIRMQRPTFWGFPFGGDVSNTVLILVDSDNDSVLPLGAFYSRQFAPEK